MISYNAIRKNKTLLQVLNAGKAALAEGESKKAATAESDKKD